MKQFFAVVFSFLAFSYIDAKRANHDDIYKITLSNNIDVVLYENFNSSLVTVGVIYDVGYFDANKCKFCVDNIVSRLFCDKHTKYTFLKNGVTYDVNVFRDHTELLCKMHPKSLEKALKCIARRFVKSKDISYLKQQLLIENKVCKINELKSLDDVACGMLSRNTTDLIFDDAQLEMLSNDDVSSFLNKYNICNIRIIVCGAISYKGLMKAMRNSISIMPLRDQLKSRNLIKLNRDKTVKLEGIYCNNAIHLFYLIPENHIKMCAYFAILNTLIDMKMIGEHPYIGYYSNTNYAVLSKYIQNISLYPKADISLNELQKLWTLFCLNIANFELSDDLKNKISERQKVFEDIAKTDLMQMYYLIKNALLNNIDIKNILSISTEITKISADEFRDISTKMLEKNLLLKIIEQHRAFK